MSGHQSEGAFAWYSRLYSEAAAPDHCMKVGNLFDYFGFLRYNITKDRAASMLAQSAAEKGGTQ